MHLKPPLLISKNFLYSFKSGIFRLFFFLLYFCHLLLLRFLEPLHLPDLDGSNLLGVNMNLAHLGAKRILTYILHLLLFINIPNRFRCGFHEVIRSDLRSPQLPVYWRSNFFQFYSRNSRPRLFQKHFVASHVNSVFDRSELECVLDASKPNICDLRTSEEICQQTFQPLHVGVGRVGKRLSGENQARFAPDGHFGVFKVVQRTEVFNPSSTISRRWLSYILPMTILLGLFLLWFPNMNKEASFFCAKNSNFVASSKGRISFFLLKNVEYGLFKFPRSFIHLLTKSLHFAPLTNKACFVFSMALGSLSSSALLLRCFLGLTTRCTTPIFSFF